MRREKNNTRDEDTGWRNGTMPAIDAIDTPFFARFFILPQHAPLRYDIARLRCAPRFIDYER